VDHFSHKIMSAFIEILTPCPRLHSLSGRSGLGMSLTLLPQNSGAHQTEAVVAVPAVRVVAAAPIGRTSGLRRIDPTPAACHPFATRSRPLRISLRRAGIHPIPVPAPLHHVPAHVIYPKTIVSILV